MRLFGDWHRLATLTAAMVVFSGCAATAPIGTKNGKVPSRSGFNGLFVTTEGRSDEPVAKVHVVESGDTLWGVAQKYGITVEQIKAFNEVENVRHLTIGAALVVSDGRIDPSLKGRSGSGSARQKSPKKSKKYALQWPLKGTITARYGQRRGRPHDGIDIKAKLGTPVLAAGSGEVVFSDRHGGYGNLVVIRHSSGLVTVYAHNKKNLAKKGAQIKTGQRIALVGNTGESKQAHLHFEVRRGANPQNPLRFLPPN